MNELSMGLGERQVGQDVLLGRGQEVRCLGILRLKSLNHPPKSTLGIGQVDLNEDRPDQGGHHGLCRLDAGMGDARLAFGRLRLPELAVLDTHLLTVVQDAVILRRGGPGDAQGDPLAQPQSPHPAWRSARLPQRRCTDRSVVEETSAVGFAAGCGGAGTGCGTEPGPFERTFKAAGATLDDVVHARHDVRDDGRQGRGRRGFLDVTAGRLV